MLSKAKARVLDRINTGLKAIGMPSKGKLSDILMCEKAITQVASDVKQRKHNTYSAVVFDFANTILMQNPLSLKYDDNVALTIHVLAFGELARNIELLKEQDPRKHSDVVSFLSECDCEDSETQEMVFIRRISKFCFKINKDKILAEHFDSKFLMAVYKKMQENMPNWLEKSMDC